VKRILITLLLTAGFASISWGDVRVKLTVDCDDIYAENSLDKSFRSELGKIPDVSLVHDGEDCEILANGAGPTNLAFGVSVNVLWWNHILATGTVGCVMRRDIPLIARQDIAKINRDVFEEIRHDVLMAKRPTPSTSPSASTPN
jgi:hypothetical protein